MLMKVVLPAPLVPMRPTTESFSIAALTSLAAVTAPKDLFKPLASRMTDIFSEPRPQALAHEHDDAEERNTQAHLPGIGRKVVGGSVDDPVEQRAGERRHHAANASEDGDEDEFAGGGPERHLRIDMPHGGGGESAADAREHGGDHVHDVHRAA